MRTLRFGRWGIALVAALATTVPLVSAAVVDRSSPPATTELRPIAAVRTDATPLAAPAACGDGFVSHTLPHSTSAGAVTRLFDSNGAGLALGDLDDDGDLDILMAGLRDENAVLWNEGALRFRREPLSVPGGRAAQIVDVDGDGRLDLIVTRGSGPPILWRNTSASDAPTFERRPLPGVTRPAHVMTWADLDGDGALDLVTASYDAALALEDQNRFLFGEGGGVFLYEQRDGEFAETRLDDVAQALALGVWDLDGDGQPEIAVGNDFDLPDRFWGRTSTGWSAVEPLAVTTHSTMSFDWGDLDNNGTVEWFATDMKPYDRDIETLAAWMPLMEKAYQSPRAALGRQVRANVLLRDGRNAADAMGVDATGWSWAGRFGDLDNDGWLDLYVVNGMIAEDLLAHLPGGELIEANRAYRNLRGERFAPAPEWSLDATASGRGMVMGDLDLDGDLDIVVNNLNSPATLFENRHCGGGALEVELRWSASGNSRGIGSRLRLHTDAGILSRDLRAGSGYLSGDPARVHFGFAAGTTLDSLEILWPDGRRSVVRDPRAGTLLTVLRRGDDGR